MFDLDGCDLVDDVMGTTGKRPNIEKGENVYILSSFGNLI